MPGSPFMIVHSRGKTDDTTNPVAGSAFSENRASFDPELLAARGMRLGRLACLLHLCEHFANGIVGPGAALFPPSLEALALCFQIAEEVRAAEHRAPRSDHRLHLFPDGPLLPVAFEEKVFVDKAAVYDARHHFPITEHHAHVCVFPASGRTDTHQVLLVFCVEVDREPLPRFAQPWLTPVLVQTQHQIDLFVRCFAHVSSFGFGFWTDSFAPFFAPNFITTSVVNPPADMKLPASRTALPMQNGHMSPFTANATPPPASERLHGCASSPLRHLFGGLPKSVQAPCDEKRAVFRHLFRSSGTVDSTRRD